jgi:hypothetical protein
MRITLPLPYPSDSSIAVDGINPRWHLPGGLTGLGGGAMVEPGRGVEEGLFIDRRSAHGQPQNLPVPGCG